MDDWQLLLSQRIVRASQQNGFIGAITKGPRGSGKSMYNLKTMALAHYLVDNCTETQAWTRALHGFVFSPDELIAKVEHNIDNDTIELCWCIDDAAVHFSSLLFFVNLYKSALVTAMFDTIRTVVRALLVNCPEKKRLMRALRNYDDYEMTVYKAPGNYNRRAVAIKWYSMPSGDRKFRKEFEDHFSCYVPKWIYEKYMEKRKRYLKEINIELKRLKSKLEEQHSKRQMTEAINDL